MAGAGLYANIAAKKKRIASGSGESMRSPGSKGAPKKGDFVKAAKTASFNEGGEAKIKPYVDGESKIKPYVNGAVSSSKEGTGGGGRLGFRKSIDKDTDMDAYLEGGGFKPKGGELKGSISGVGVKLTKRFATGGEAKSKVNAAGNYTKPELRKRIFNAVKAEATAGTGAGEWSARKAQMVAQRYKKAGGGYRD